ncbi:MAG: sigma-70 family RNA polymerase sigma factor [Acidobacteria bacterium]|nr:MAG: sigma-70 family RNA polymerase sigma factor [Acidobacteriota bacterium]REK11686.1 MAG: sigma-70 family RNA polymerase sigma factor [Acidobacteriota bacterium]
MRHWRACAVGGGAAWSELVEKVHRTVFGYAVVLCRKVRDEGVVVEPEDVVQDLYLRLLADDRRVLHRSRFANDGQLLAFLRRIVARLVLDQVRRSRSRSRREAAHRERFQLPAEGCAGEVAERADPERTYLLREALHQLAGLCDEATLDTTHPARNREVFRRMVLGRHGAAEVARSFGMSPSAVHALVHRTKRRIERDHGVRLGAIVPERVPRQPAGR